MPHDDDTAQLTDDQRTSLGHTLIQLMSDISEDHYAAGWLTNLEYSLWEVIESDNPRFGFGNVDPSRIQQLRTLRELSGFWAFYDGKRGETLIPADEFAQRFKDFTA